MTIETGTKLGRSKSGQGVAAVGEGAAYLSQDMKFDRKVALKILQSKLK